MDDLWGCEKCVKEKEHENCFPRILHELIYKQFVKDYEILMKEKEDHSSCVPRELAEEMGDCLNGLGCVDDVGNPCALFPRKQKCVVCRLDDKWQSWLREHPKGK